MADLLKKSSEEEFMVDSYSGGYAADEVAEDDYESNDSFADATEIKLSSTAGVEDELYASYDYITIHDKSDVDYFKFNLTQNSSLYFDVYREMADVTLYDANKEVIAENYFYGLALAKGTYYFKVESNYPEIYSFSISARELTGDACEPNNSMKNAYVLDISTGCSSASELSLHTLDDVDYFKFTVDETTVGNLFSIYAYSDASYNTPEYSIYDSNGNSIANFSDPDDSYFNFLDAGDYYLKIESDRLISNYGLDVNSYFIDDLGSLNENNDSIYVKSDSTDYYKFNLQQTGLVQIFVVDSEENDLGYRIADEELEFSYKGNYMVLAAGDHYLNVTENYGDDYSVTIESIDAVVLGNLNETENQSFSVTGSGEEGELFYYEFTLSESGIVSMIPNTYVYDVNFSVISTDGIEISTWYGQHNKRLDAGTYYAVADISYDSEYSFNLSYKSGNPDDCENNDSEKQAYDLGDISKTNEKKLENLSIDYYGDVDYFKFTLTSDGYVNLNTDVIKSEYNYSDLYYEIYNSEGDVEYDDEIDYDDAWWGEYGFHDSKNGRKFFKAGTYYVSLSSYDGLIDDYTLSVKYSKDAKADRYEDNNTIKTAKSIGKISGANLRIDNLNFHHISDVDHYKVTLDEEKFLWVQTPGCYTSVYSPDLYGGEGGFLTSEGSSGFHLFDDKEVTLGIIGRYSDVEIPEYSLLIKSLEKNNKTVSGTSNSNGIFTTGDVTLSANAQLNTSELSAICLVDESIFNKSDYYSEDYYENVDYLTVTLNNKTVITNKEYSCDTETKSAIYIGGGNYDGEYATEGKIIFNGSNIEISVDAGQGNATGITSSYEVELELVFKEDAKDSEDINITVLGGSATGIGCAMGEGGYINITGSFGGNITAISANGIAIKEHYYASGSTGIGAYSINMDGDLAGKIVALDKSTDSFDLECYGTSYGICSYDTNINEISGTIAALKSCQCPGAEPDEENWHNCSGEIYGIYSYGSLNTTVSGTIFAGSISSEIDLDKFMEKLADPSNAENKELLIKSSENFYAIQSGRSNITVTKTANIWGSINVDTGSTITISSQARVYGDIYYYRNYYDSDNTEYKLIFELDRITANTTVSGSIYHSYSQEDTELAIVIDASEARNGVYSLCSSCNIDNYNFSISCKDEVIALEDAEVDADGNYLFKFADNMCITIDSADGLTLQVSNSTFVEPDYENPAKVSGISAAVDKGNAVISWNEATDDIGVVKYEFLYGTSSNLSGTGEFLSDTKFEFQNMQIGTYYCKVRAYDAFGNAGDWSNQVQFTVKDYIAPVLNEKSPELQQIVKDSVVITWSEASDDQKVAGYKVKYIFEDKEYIKDVGNKLELKITDLDNGSYSFTVGAYDEVGNISWHEMNEFSIDYIAPDKYEDNNVIEYAYALGTVCGKVVSVIDGNIDVEDDVDWFAFTLDKSGKVDFDITGVDNAVIFDSAMNECTNMVFDKGSYYIQIHGARTKNYSFNISAVEFAAPFSVEPALPENIAEISNVVTSITLEEGEVFKHESSSVDNIAIYLPRSSYNCTVTAFGDEEESEQLANAEVPGEEVGSSVLIESSGDSSFDIFFGEAGGIWSDRYVARHTGSFGEENSEIAVEDVKLGGKNKITDFFFGAENVGNVLVLTDADNGDALFVDDVYSAAPSDIYRSDYSRLANLKEILAGAGDDIVDMTSNKFEYSGDGVIVRGGDGNDVIWANSGSNRLFGDDGNDDIVGAYGDDLIVGGLGNDTLIGGGGSDVFAFGYNDGVDTVRQIAGGSVTLWFADENVSQEENVFTYGDGCQVTVEGIDFNEITVLKGAAASDDELFGGKTSDKNFNLA